MADQWGHRSGADWKAEIAQRFGLNSSATKAATTNVHTVVLDETLNNGVLEKSINDELKVWWQRVADTDPDRIAAEHEFVYPVNAECVAMRPGAGSMVAQMSPPMPRPWIVLRTLHDVSQSMQPIMLEWVQYESFLPLGMRRWTYTADRLYIADQYGILGLTTALSCRLRYVPFATQIDLTSDVVRTDIPLALHNVVMLGGMKRCLAAAHVKLESSQHARLEHEHAEDSATAIRTITRPTTRSHTQIWSDEPMMENR